MSKSGNPLPPELLENQSDRLVVATTVLLVLTTIAVGLRLLARTSQETKRGWDDYLLLPAWALFMGTCAVCYLAVYRGGSGQHVQVAIIKDPGLVTRGKLVYALSWVSGLSAILSRTSICILYLRVFHTRNTRLMAWTVLLYLLGFSVSQIITTASICTPVSYYWNRALEPDSGTCINMFLFYQINSVLDVTVDLAILLVPIPVIYSLKQSLLQKLGLAVVFANGLLGLIASIIRCTSFFINTQIWVTDPTWADRSLEVWTLVQASMYLIAASLIGTRPIIRRVWIWASSTQLMESFTRLTTSFRRSSDDSGQHLATRPSTNNSVDGLGEMRNPNMFIHVQSDFEVKRAVL